MQISLHWQGHIFYNMIVPEPNGESLLGVTLYVEIRSNKQTYLLIDIIASIMKSR